MSPHTPSIPRSTDNLDRMADVDLEFVVAMREAMSLSTVPSTTAPKAGELAPVFQLKDINGKEIALTDLLLRGAVVINFHRGEWCPYCNFELRRLASTQPEMKALGATLVAISPDFGGAADSAVNADAHFLKLLDPASEVAQTYGVSFDLAFSLRDLYTRYGAALPSVRDSGSVRMPLPATFVVGQNSRIVLSFIDNDYRHQLQPEAVLDALRGLKERRRR